MNEIITKIVINIELINTIFGLNVKNSKFKTICVGANLFNDSINTSLARPIKIKYPIVDIIIVDNATNINCIPNIVHIL